MIFLSLQSRGSGLGLSAAHEQSVSEFLRFARFKRGQCVKTVETAFQHLADSRLVEDTFTCERGGVENGRLGESYHHILREGGESLHVRVYEGIKKGDESYCIV